MDSLTAICEDLLQLRDEIADPTYRPAADEICARLTLIASRVEALDSQHGRFSEAAYGKEVDGEGVREASGSAPSGIGRAGGEEYPGEEAGAGGPQPEWQDP